jgi:signal transduction histidine kinase
MGSEISAKARMALRWRLTIWIALAFSFAVVSVFLVVWLAVTRILEDDITDGLNRNYENVFGRAILSDSEGYEQLVQAFPFPVAIYDPSGTLIAANTDADLTEMQLSEKDAVRITVERKPVEETIVIRGERFRVRAASLRGQTDVFGIVQVGRSTETVQDVRDTMALILLIGGVASLIAVSAVGYGLARSALRPIEKIARTAGEIEASDLTRRIGARREPAEVQRLSDTFDAMLARLETAFSQQRNFVMDVSHELRTPLTGLRGNLDVMLMDPALDQETRQQLEKMSSEVSRLIRLTSNLLYLAHAEAGRDIARRPVDLDALCLEVVHQERNVRSDISLRLVHEEQVSVSCDRDLLKQLLLNVVDNAIKFSPEQGQVIVGLVSRDGVVEVAVEDEGPGIPPEQLDTIFQRFHQGPQDGSRSAGGAGIGLAISRWIVQVHGGEIRAENRENSGSRFVITLPSDTATEPAAS